MKTFAAAGDHRSHAVQRCALLVLATLLATSPARSAELLPDLVALSDQSLGYMYDGAIDNITQPGRDLYRFSTAIGNAGEGPFEVIETTADGTQKVWQNIYSDDGTIAASFIGEFDDPQPAFGHLFLESLARYSLRAILPGGGVGPVVATNDKTSFGVIDSVIFDTELPNAPIQPNYTSVSEPELGISVGWADLYGRQIPGQWIDVTGLFGGEYWLEVIIDPLGYVNELSKANNTARVRVHVDLPQVPEPAAGALLIVALCVASATRRQIGVCPSQAFP